MKYEIVKDEVALADFISWLPDLGEYEKFYICLFARKKYDDALQSTSSDKMQLKRDLVNKEHIIQKLKQWEVEEGLYTLKDTAATQQSLAVYIAPNPRCMIKAQGDLVKRLVDAMVIGNHFKNPKAEAISSAQKSKAYNFVVDFDIDDKTVDLSKMGNILLSQDYKILETRGGYHILVDCLNASKHNSLVHEPSSEVFKERYPLDWHSRIRATFPIDQHGDQMIPIPGCTQGNFIPKFIEI